MPLCDQNTVWLYVYDKGEARYSDLINEFISSGKCSKQTLLNYKRELEKEKKLVKKLSEKTGRPVYYVPMEFRPQAETLKKKLNFQTELNSLPLEQQKIQMEKLTKELVKYKRRERIRELEKMPLPGLVVERKLEKLGLKLPLHEELGGSIGLGDEFDSFKTEDIEIKLLPKKNFPRGYQDVADYLVDVPGLPPYSRGWRLTFHSPVKGKFIFGAYKELLQLHKEEFESEWLEWKEKFSLTDDDWKKIGPEVRGKMESESDPCLRDEEIRFFLNTYVDSKTLEGQERIKAFWKKELGPKEGEKVAVRLIENYRQLGKG